MPALIFEPVHFCVGVKIHGLYAAGPVEMINTLNFRSVVSDPDGADCAAVANLVGDWISTDYAPLYAQNIEVVGVEAFSRSAPDGANHFLSTIIPGTLTGTFEQLDAAPLILLKTGLRGRSRSGRFYALPPTADKIQIGQYATSFMVQFYPAFANLMTAASTAGYALVVASPTLDSVQNVTSIAYSPRMTRQTRRRQTFGR